MDAIVRFFKDFYGSAWFTVIVVVLSLVIAWFIIRAVYKRLCRSLIGAVKYTREFSQSGAFEGETVVLTETLHNRSFLPIIFVDIWGYIFNDLRVEGAEYNDRLAMQPFAGRFSMLMPFMQLKRKHTVLCAKRGYYKLEGVEMLISDSHKYVESTASIYVYPLPIDPPELPQTMSALQGESYSHNWLMRDPFNISGVRDYAFGDPFNSINFKATAKTGGFAGHGIKVNNCDFVSNRTIMIYADFRRDPKVPLPSKVQEAVAERFLSGTSGILNQARAAGYRAGFAANCTTADNDNSVRFPIYGGDAHFTEIMRALAIARTAPGVSFSGLLDHDISRGLSNTEIYVFAFYTDDSVDERLRILRRMGNTVNLMIFDGKGLEDGKEAEE